MAERAVLVTGGAGYIGSHVILALLEAGRLPVVVDNLKTGARSAVPADVPFYEGSVLDGALLSEVIKRHEVASVIHFAALVSVPDSVADPAGYYLNNTCGTLQLADAAQKAGVDSFLFSSSAAVYGIPETTPVAEDAPTRPINPYGSTKLMSEVILRDLTAAHPGFRHVALRYFNAAGADAAGRAGQQRPDIFHLIDVAIEVALGIRPRLNLYGQDFPTRDGTCERDYVHVTDLAAAHVAALRYLEAGGESTVFNCGCGRGYTVLEVVHALEKELGRELPKQIAPRRPGDPASLVAAVDHINSVLGWKAEHADISEMIRSALAWKRKLVGQPTGRPAAGEAGSS